MHTTLHITTSSLLAAAAVLTALAVSGCGSNTSAKVAQCTPDTACTCTTGTQRATACSCAGGSTCTIDGDNIEFSCQGNAACGLDCGTNCLITCPGTTSCTVTTGDMGEITCPGTASCDITCNGDCAVDVAGTANAVVHCASGATCDITGCNATDCGGGVSACRTACPGSADAGTDGG